MPEQYKLDQLYLDISDRISEMSHSRRKKVGAVLVEGENIISYGWNGTPRGADNNCEIENDDGSLTTKPEVLHAESNVLMKLVSSGGVGAQGATLYVTLSPCIDCAKLIVQSKIKRVVYREDYRITTGIDFLRKYGVQVQQLKNSKPTV